MDGEGLMGKGVRGSSESEKGWMGRGGGIGRGGWGRGAWI